MSLPRPLVIGGFVGSSAAAVILSSLVAQREILLSQWAVLWLMVAWVPVWVVGAHLGLRLPRRWALAAVIGVGVLLRLVAIGQPPPLSDDLHRYSWDASVQATGIDPYSHPPDSSALADLRGDFLWPDEETCRSLVREPGCTRINRPAERTIYPPVAQIWFSAVRLLSLGADGPAPWQAAAALVDLGLCGLLVTGLRRLGRDPLLVSWWALSPFAVVEVVANAHVDGLAALLCVAAVLTARKRPALAGALIGAATMVKLYPAVLLLAVARRAPIRAGAGFVGVCVVALLPHLLIVGPKIVGYLPGYLREEKYDQGGRFLLLAGTQLRGTALPIVAAVVLTGFFGWLWWSGMTVERAAPLTLAAVLVVATPVQPWYALTAAAVGVLLGRPVFALLGVAAWPYFFAVILDHPEATLIGQIGYGVAAIAIVWTTLSDFGQSRTGEGATMATCPPIPTPATGPSPPATPASTGGSARRS